MSQLKRNIIANFAGSGWTAVMALAFIPIYIHFMGIEAYGLVGIFVTLQAISGLMDMGLSLTLNRELARLSVHPDRSGEMRNLVRTLEWVYWSIAAGIGVAVVLLAAPLAQHWVQAKHLSPHTVQQAVMLMGLAITIQLPCSFYSGGLLGLQRQVLLNIILGIMATFRGVGAILVLWLISPTTQAFFAWQILSGVTQTWLVARFLWASLPPAQTQATFQRKVLEQVWRFAMGVSGIGVTMMILAQMDKIILSKLLSLEMFGYYSLASAVSMGLYRVTIPIYTAAYPRFTQLVATNDQAGLKRLYHGSCQLMAVLLLPAAAIIALFAPEILLLWTGNPSLVEKAHTILSLLIIGMAMNGLAYLPYALQLAHGWTRLYLYSNIVALLILVPAIMWMTWRYGAIGAAIVWMVLNSGYLLITLQLMHRFLLPEEKWRWYGEDVGLPLIAVILTAGLGRLLVSDQLPGLAILFSLLATFLASLTAAVFATRQTRTWALAHIGKLVSGLAFRWQ